MKRPLTLQGYRGLLAEHEQLHKVERPRVVTGVTNAAAEGDRSENAEYIYGKKRLREIDKRLQYLSSLLTDVEIIDPATLQGDKVCFGATVVIKEAKATSPENSTRRWQIVGEGESDTAKGTISWRSPMAKALIGKAVGDLVTVERPAGEIEVEVVELWFGERRA
ncbi:MAG: GreA/GreB family elongation factor [Deltaproteobacteria bacterium]|nr:GreA/GreB family elongation factor [Deltaproteobacteria bacterium]